MTQNYKILWLAPCHLGELAEVPEVDFLVENENDTFKVVFSIIAVLPFSTLLLNFKSFGNSVYELWVTSFIDCPFQCIIQSSWGTKACLDKSIKQDSWTPGAGALIQINKTMQLDKQNSCYNFDPVRIVKLKMLNIQCSLSYFFSTFVRNFKSFGSAIFELCDWSYIFPTSVFEFNYITDRPTFS